jgi:hypothetical protein
MSDLTTGNEAYHMEAVNENVNDRVKWATAWGSRCADGIKQYVHRRGQQVEGTRRSTREAIDLTDPVNAAEQR